MIAVDNSRTAMLVCHLQTDIIQNPQALGQMFGPEVARREVVGHAGRLLDAARSADVTRILIRIAWREGGANLLANMPLLRAAKDMGVLIDGTPGADFVPELKTGHDDLVVTHHRPNPFTGTDLHTILQVRGVDTVIVCGVATNMIVQITTFGAADLGYRVVVAEDGCSAATPEAHEASIESLGLAAEITTVDEVAEALRERPGSRGDIA
jgi:nicotinamidase-related amidase